LHWIAKILQPLNKPHQANYSCKKFSGMTYRLATIHPWQTDRQTDDRQPLP